MKNKSELLSPAGGPESLLAALRCGADAVYLGGRSLNARRAAAGFSSEELAGAVADCHLRGAKLYLTLNTLVFDDELGELYTALEEACRIGVDAVIVQDLAVAAAVRRHAPGLPLHASTQMSVHSLDGAKALEQLGFARVVVARELSAEEIGRITRGTSLAVECFVHGALCMSVSGQCTLSSMIGGRSGNRGLCAQPCRLPFRAGGSTHALSLKDVSLVGHIPLLGELGVASLKIEGRMKRPEYVAAATSACRAALDGGKPDLAALEAVFSRSGFTDGYLTGKRGASMFGTRSKEDVTAAAPVLGRLAALYQKERQSVPVDFSLRLRRGEPAALTARDRDAGAVTATGEAPQEAISAPTTPEKAAAALSKTGGTVYTICNLSTDIDDGMMFPASGLNALRRQALEKLTALRTAPRPHAWSGAHPPDCPPHTTGTPPLLRVRLHSHSQLTPELLAGADELLLPAAEAAKLPPGALESLGNRLILELPRILFDSEEYPLNDILRVLRPGGRVMAGGLGHLIRAKELGFAVSGDFSLNATNTAALAEYAALGLSDITLSFELELPRITRLGGPLPRGMLAYGHLPLMALRNCPVKAARGCQGCTGFPELRDRKDSPFFVSCRDRQVAELYNWLPLYLGDRRAELRGVDFLTLYFTWEPPAECRRIFNLFQRGEALPGEKTRGLSYRKVL